MPSNKVKLGTLIGILDHRNEKGELGVESVRGISTQKAFIETKADMEGVSLSSYKIVPPGSFAYVPDTSRRGEKISLAFNDSDQAYLVSSISVVFSVLSGDLDPLFLFMFFNRPEFDRYARFNSWGSVREAFTWQEMCDIEIALPSLSLQRSYSAIYKNLMNNKAAIEAGVLELQSVLNSLLDDAKKKYPFVSVSGLLEEIDRRNADGVLKEVRGIDIHKRFIKTVADVSKVDIKKYKVVLPGEIAFSGMQTGRDECIRIALNSGERPILISPAYSVFKVNKGKANPTYIQMWFSRAESDRRGWFMSDSSIRANLDLDRFFETKIPLPPLGIQCSYEKFFTCFEQRRYIAESFKNMLSNLCSILLVGAGLS